MFEYKTKHYRTLKTERGRNMAKATHTTIVTRDETDIAYFFVEIWPISAKLEKIEGEWVSENNVERITILPISLFKKIFSYVPGAGSKETKTIDEAILNAMRGKVLLTC